MVRTRLSPVSGRQRYCGPCAISATTGESSDDAARAIREATGRPRIFGTTEEEVIAGIKRLGHDACIWDDFRNMVSVKKVPYPTLKKWLEATSAKEYEGFKWILSCGNHWIAMAFEADGSASVADSGYMFSETPKIYDGRADRKRVKTAIAVDVAS